MMRLLLSQFIPSYFITMPTLLICTLSFAIVTLVQGLVVCPSPAESYSPCSCDEYTQQPGTISLYCAFMNLNDSAVSDILDSFVSQSTISPIAELRLESNLLTRVPDQIRLFPQLYSVQLYGNEIEQIPPAAFNITVSPVRIVLYLNRIKTIAPYAFQSNNNISIHTLMICAVSNYYLKRCCQRIRKWFWRFIEQ